MSIKDAFDRQRREQLERKKEEVRRQQEAQSLSNINALAEQLEKRSRNQVEAELCEVLSKVISVSVSSDDTKRYSLEISAPAGGAFSGGTEGVATPAPSYQAYSVIRQRERRRAVYLWHPLRFWYEPDSAELENRVRARSLENVRWRLGWANDSKHVVTLFCRWSGSNGDERLLGADSSMYGELKFGCIQVWSESEFGPANFQRIIGQQLATIEEMRERKKTEAWIESLKRYAPWSRSWFAS